MARFCTATLRTAAAAATFATVCRAAVIGIRTGGFGGGGTAAGFGVRRVWPGTTAGTRDVAGAAARAGAATGAIRSTSARFAAISAVFMSALLVAKRLIGAETANGGGGTAAAFGGATAAALGGATARAIVFTTGVGTGAVARRAFLDAAAAAVAAALLKEAVLPPMPLDETTRFDRLPQLHMRFSGGGVFNINNFLCLVIIYY